MDWLARCVPRSNLPPRTHPNHEIRRRHPGGSDIVRSRTLVRPQALRVGSPWTASGRWGRQAADHRESHWRAFSVTAKCRFDTAMLRGAIELLPSGPTVHSGTDRRPAETFRNARAPRVSRVVTILHKFSVNRVLSASWRSPASGDRWHPGSNFGDVSGDGEQSPASDSPPSFNVLHRLSLASQSAIAGAAQRWFRASGSCSSPTAPRTRRTFDPVGLPPTAGRKLVAGSRVTHGHRGLCRGVLT